MLVNQPTAKPTRKVTAFTLGSVLAAVLVNLLGVEADNGVLAELLDELIVVLVGGSAAWLTRERLD